MKDGQAEMITNQMSQLAATILLFATGITLVLAQLGSETEKQLHPPAVNWTEVQDQKNMMD
jgi:hypothetical protein